MKTILIVLTVIFGLLYCGQVSAQDDALASRGAYDRCVKAMSYDRQSAYRVCKEYLEKYPGDDREHVQPVRKWVTAYKRALDYAKSLRSFSSVNPGHDWFIYEPDLSVEVPEVVERDGHYRIEIVYSYGSPLEAALLKKAEAVYGSQEKFIRMISQDPISWSEDLPDKVVPLWGVRGNDNLQMTEVITASALRYYYDLSVAMREKRKFHNVFQMIDTSLKYHATIKHYENYEHSGHKFQDAYVADLKLEWSSICGGLCGIGFERNKLVVFDNTGNVLALFLDSSVNQRFWVS